MKKKTSWKTLAGLALAVATWSKIAEDLPIYADVIPDQPQCGRFETAKWDADTKRWRCVPKGLL